MRSCAQRMAETDALSQALNDILQNPAQLQRIISLAGSLGLGADAPQSEPADVPELPQAQESSLPVSFTPPVVSAASSQRHEALLRALKPFLKPEKWAKLDRAMQLARLSHLAEAALRSTQNHREEEDAQHV